MSECSEQQHIPYASVSWQLSCIVCLGRHGQEFSCFPGYVLAQKFWSFRAFLVIIQGYKNTRIQGNLFASDNNMYIGICLADVIFTRKKYITNTSLVIDNSDLNYGHVVQLTQAHGYVPICTYTLLTYRQTYAALYRCTQLTIQAHTQVNKYIKWNTIK